MREGRLRFILTKIKYDNNDIEYRYVKGDNCYCYPYDGIVCLNILDFVEVVNNDSLFSILHEIGHIRTNKRGMRRSWEEYLATQWAIDNAAKYGVELTESNMVRYQKYINRHYYDDFGKDPSGLPNIIEYKLKYKL